MKRSIRNKFIVSVLIVSMLWLQFSSYAMAMESPDTSSIIATMESTSEGQTLEEQTSEEQIIEGQSTGEQETEDQTSEEQISEEQPIEEQESDEQTTEEQESEERMEEYGEIEELLPDADNMDVALFAVSRQGYSTLDEVKSLNSDAFSVDEDGTLQVKGADGLILLSQVNPEEYYQKTIKLSTLDEAKDYYDLANPITIGQQEFCYQGLGSSDYPFEGKIIYVSGSDKKWIISQSIFNALSPNAQLPSEGIRISLSEDIEKTILAQTVKNGTTEAESVSEWKVSFSDSAHTIGGMIGTIESGAVKLSISVEVEGSSTLSCQSSDSHIGLFCGEMFTGSKLTATIASGINIEVHATGNNCDAGGFVGYMKEGAELTVSGTIPGSITADNGNAGGLVGSAQDVTIKSIDNAAITIGNTSIKAGSGKGAGGIAGEYFNTQTINFPISAFAWSDSNCIKLSGENCHAGGVFGVLRNRDNFKISPASQVSIYSKLNSNVDNYGGLIGAYWTVKNDTTENGDNLGISFVVNNVNIFSNANNKSLTANGGVIGTIPYTGYVQIEGVTTNLSNGDSGSLGGIIGKAGESGAVLLNIGTETSGQATVIAGSSNSSTTGGIVGSLNKGVVRLHGTTDLSGFEIIKSGSSVGQIVGYNGDGLVYGAGTGKALNNGTGWLLRRCAGATASDIGNWGAVVRLDGSTLKEEVKENDTIPTDTATLFVFDKVGHTVTIQGEPKDTYSINSVRDFTAYALAFDYGNSISPVLQGGGVNSANIQTITINTDIDLTGTGILGIGRDFGDFWNTDPTRFIGSITGTDSLPTVKLDIGGSVYGEDAPTDGLLKVYDSAHNLLAFLPKAGDVTISKLKISGNVKGTANGSWGNRGIAAVIALGVGSLTFDQVVASASLSAAGSGSEFRLAGFLCEYLGGYDNNRNYDLIFSNCTWDGSITSEGNGTLGGFVGNVNNNCNTTVNMSNCDIKGSITVTENVQDVKWGGLVVQFQKDNTSQLNLSNLSVEGATFQAESSTNTCGGFFGYLWRNTNVTFGTPAGDEQEATGGVTISSSTLNAPNASFGGLVYQASGYWNATAKDSIRFIKKDDVKNKISGKTTQSNPSGLLVCKGIEDNNRALYLEVGTWGDAVDAAYSVSSNSLELSLSGDTEYFDELVGRTISGQDYFGENDSNGVVSLAMASNALIDVSSCNTYTNQMGTDYKNPYSRYYYNLNKFRGDISSNSWTYADSAIVLDTPGKVVLWSVSLCVANNIRALFCSAGTGTAVQIQDKIDLSGYSYYPVTSSAKVSLVNSALTFAYEVIESVESANKKPSDSDKQHYLMHCGLLYNHNYDLNLENVTLAGTVGIYNNESGALIFGNITGNPTASPEVIRTISMSQVTLQGLRVSGVNEETTYAPLLINTIGQGVNLTINDLKTSIGYVTTDDSTKVTSYAASSLIGKVGSSTATKLTLSFANIALDSRINNAASTSVKNNGNDAYKVEYNTTHSIFTQATLLDSFQYTTSSSGSYNFNSVDTQVTYGKEISNTSSGRNLGKQYQYYDVDQNVWDGESGSTNPTDGEITTYYVIGYLPYVKEYERQGTENYKELDINLRVAHLLNGCGTYGDPYLITSGEQLVAVADFLMNGSTASAWGVCINETVYSNQKQDAGGFHIAGGDNGNDIKYLCEGTTWYTAIGQGNGQYSKGEKVESVNIDGIRAYLRNAYYQIQNDIEISNNSYIGLGGSDAQKNTFSGVIVGKKLEQNKYPTIMISVKNQNVKSFGGLICYSQGSVVKDLNISYTKKDENGYEIDTAEITVSNSAVPDGTNNPFFGGVVGYCMGGDTIIDNVSVLYGTNSITLSNGNVPGMDRLIAAGGYVGLVGGSKESDGYERKGGGVIFQNMNGRTNPFMGAILSASVQDSTYFYCNPFVGRVLDGYACYEGGTVGNSTLNNTDKNYTIPDIVSGSTDLEVSSSFEINVKSAQGLWLLSTIVNSGAAAMDANGSYADVSGTVTAYQQGKPRNADYDKIGTTEGVNHLIDEAYWGGAGTDDIGRVSRLVKKYTSGEDTSGGKYAAKLTGRSKTNDTKPNNVVSIIFSNAEIDMSPYANGFRGIGASYGYSNTIYNTDSKDTDRNRRRSLYVCKIKPNDDIENVKINFNMNQKLYCEEAPSGTSTTYSNQGLGLFVHIGLPNTTVSYNSSQTNCLVSNLTLSGKVETTYYKVSDGSTKAAADRIYGESCVGAFAARTLQDDYARSLVFKNLALEKLSVGGAANAGGVLGSVLPKRTSVDFLDTQADDLTVFTYVNQDGNAGGLVGYYAPQTDGTLYIAEETSQNLKWSQVKVLLTATVGRADWNYAAVGGLVGKCEKRPVIIKNVQFGGTVTAIKCNQVGGLVGYAKGGGTFTDVTVTNIEVNASGSQAVGGLVGFVEGGGTFTNVTVEDTKVYSVGSYYIGGLAGRTKEKVSASNVTVKGNTSIIADADTNSYNWSQITAYIGGLFGSAENNEVAIEDCKITGISTCPVKILNGIPKNDGNNVAGGLIGYCNGNNKIITVYNTVLEYVYILSGDTAGGIVGFHNQQKLNVYDTVLTNLVVAIPGQINNNLLGNDRAGALVGYSKNYINGYNILLNDVSVGYSQYFTVPTGNKPTMSAEFLLQKMSMDTVSADLGLYNDGNTMLCLYKDMAETQNTFISKYAGRWIGQYEAVNDTSSSTGKRTCTLVAVAVKGGNLPNTDIGTATSSVDNIMRVTYADYPLIQTNTPEERYAPWLDVNPLNSSLVLRDTVGGAEQKLTGNGVGVMTASENSSSQVFVAKTILDESDSTDFSRQYCNLTDCKTLLDLENSVYLTTYQSEESTSTDVPVEIDFPVLVVNSNENQVVDSLIWSYIAAMTNVKSADMARSNADNLEIASYRWIKDSDESNTGSFIKQATASLNYNSSTKEFLTNGRFDNQQNQITVLDVQYLDPTDTNNQRVYHLYIPVLVKKILQAKVTVRMLEGTNYFGDAYQNNNYVAAGFNENVTALIEFNYQHTKEEWQTSLDEGENLLWSYQKSISLIADEKGKLPAGTKLTLLDNQTRKVYTHSLTETDNQMPLEFSTVFGTSEQPWEDTPVCDLLNIKVSVDTENGKYVKTTSTDTKATVRVPNTDGGYDYYRPMEETDTELDIYKLESEVAVNQEGYLKVGDRFYLSICVPKDEAVLAVNNLMGYYQTRLVPVEGTKAPPTKLEFQNNRYILYDGVEQTTFTIQTERVNGGNHPNGDISTSMANKDAIKITLETNLKLSEDETIKDLFNSYTPKEMYQQFAINLKKYDASGSGTDIAIGADSAAWHYELYIGSTMIAYTELEKCLPQGEEQLLITYGDDLTAKIKEAGNSGNTLTVRAVVYLYYNDITIQDFPQRGKDGMSGIGVVAQSRLANGESILSITGNKKVAEGAERYYTEVNSNANLIFDIIQTEEGTGSGDKNIQLGINPNDYDNSTTYIKAMGRYEYVNVDSAILEQADKIQYSLALYQKGEGGSYSDEPLLLGTYWTKLNVNDEEVLLQNQENMWEAKYNFDSSENTRICVLPVQFSVKTGLDFEKEGLTYSNYKVCLTAVLLDGNGDALGGTEATDFLVYTNARVYTHMME